MTEELQIRLHGSESLPILVYLPGLHGDWTLVSRFRKALAGRVRFVEITYPRTLTWSLDDYAAALKPGWRGMGYPGWLLAESFSSQVLWPLLARKRFSCRGRHFGRRIVRHPIIWGVRLGGIFLRCDLVGFVDADTFWLCQNCPITQSPFTGREGCARRISCSAHSPGPTSAKHRLHLLARNDPCEMPGMWTFQCTELPVYSIQSCHGPGFENG